MLKISLWIYSFMLLADDMWEHDLSKTFRVAMYFKKLLFFNFIIQNFTLASQMWSRIRDGIDRNVSKFSLFVTLITDMLTNLLLYLFVIFDRSSRVNVMKRLSNTWLRTFYRVGTNECMDFRSSSIHVLLFVHTGSTIYLAVMYRT